MDRLGRPLNVLFAAPAYWPATAFGGPVQKTNELAAGLVEAGCTVDVVTTSLTSPHGPRSRRTRIGNHGGATILYAATPASYRWMGITPTLPLWLARMPRPDIVHVFGYRDPVGTMVSAWCRGRGIPYVFEALGMFKPKLRKIGLKRALDASLFRHVPAAAARVVACSQIERDEYVAGGVEPGRIVVCPNGFPRVPPASPGALRGQLRISPETPLVLSVGRIASGKGLELLVRAVAQSERAHLAIIGPDDGHGTSARLRRQALKLGIGERIHLLGSREHGDVLDAYADADVVALASAHESFGMVAAEAAAAGRAILLTDRCGVAELLSPDGAVITPYDADAVRDGLEVLLGDSGLRARLGERARRVADAWSWQNVVETHLASYDEAIAEGRDVDAEARPAH